MPMPQNSKLTKARRFSDPSPSPCSPAFLHLVDIKKNIEPFTQCSADHDMLRPLSQADLPRNCKPSSSSASTLRSPRTSDEMLAPSGASEKPKPMSKSEVLVPRPFKGESQRIYHFARWGLVIIILIFTAFTLWQLTVELYLGATRVAQTCDYEKADSMERLFIIDIHVFDGLKFSYAKLLDATWDLLVGQVGRILHGWLFYHVALRALTWLSERFSAPYEFQLRVRFNTVSAESLRAAANIAVSHSKKSARVYALLVWFLLSVIYVLLFPTIWGTATGYYQPSAIGYSIPEYGPGVLRRNDFKLCWVGNMDRVVDGHSGIVVGPEATGDYMRIGYPASFGEPMSEEFRSLLAYGTTKWDILSFYNGEVPRPNVSSPESGPAVAGEIDWLSCDPYIDEYYGTDFWPCGQDGTLYSAINGWQYSIEEQIIAQKNLTTIPVDNYGTGDPNLYQTEDGQTILNNTVAKFIFDSKAMTSNPEIVPYNSSVWWAGESLPVPAPFLEFGTTKEGIKCSSRDWNFNELCICVDGEPLPWDIMSKLTPETGNLFCVGGQTYVWGFAIRIALIAALCECIWVLSCAIMWTVATKSSLIRHRRPYAGIVRNILDMATVLHDDLGSDTGTYGEKELIRELRKCQPVGYVQEEDGATSGTMRIKMDSVPTGMQKRRHIYVDPKANYS